MADRSPVAEQSLLGNGSTATSWAEATKRLETPERDRTYWLATIRPDGRPHVMPILGLWIDGAFYFVTGEGSRKGKNLGRNPRCVMAASSQTLPALDVVVEGEARKVTDEARLRRVVDAYASKMHWQLEVQGDAVVGDNAPTAGPPPYAVFELKATTVFGLPGIAGTDGGEGSKGSFTPTRWRF